MWTVKNPLVVIMAVLLMAMLLPPSAWAWGRTGHRVAARMAERQLTPSARAAVRALLGPKTSFADAATWADEQRDVPDSGQWHYVNIPIKEIRYHTRYCAAKGCVVSKIEEFRRTLLNPKAGTLQKQQALKFLIHFIADVHQPLHVGDNGDQGGNRLQVRFFRDGSNLHRVWDSQIIERHTKNEQVWLWDFDFIANPRIAAEWTKGAPEDWATESLQIAAHSYRLPGAAKVMPRGSRIGQEYCNFALPIIQKQLAKSGIRIAFMLNNVFR